VSIWGLEAARRRGTPRNDPLSARQYFEAYFPPGTEWESEQGNLSFCVDRFEGGGSKVCEQSWLDEAFPDDGYAPKGAEDSEVHVEQDAAAGGTNETFSTLAQQALKVAVQRLCAFDTDPDADAEERFKMVDDLMDSPGLDVPLVLSLLANGPVLSPSAAQPLVRLLQYTSPTDVVEGRLDLSSFPPDLQSIRQIVDASPNAVFLNLSSNGPALDSVILAYIGAALPRLQHLFLMGDATAKLNLEQLDALLCIGGALSHVHDVYHPALFNRCLRIGRRMRRRGDSDLLYAPPRPDPPFSFIRLCEDFPRVVGCSLPALIPQTSSSACLIGSPAPRPWRRGVPSSSSTGRPHSRTSALRLRSQTWCGLHSCTWTVAR
jgi:hypothetical protein